MPAAAADQKGGEWKRREKRLNRFVRLVAFGEWAGNAFGALAFVWATGVLLGGFCTSLNSEDFWFATVMIFIEAFRIFSRNYGRDNQSLFGTTRALRWMASSFCCMLVRPQEGDEVVLSIGFWIYLLDPLQSISPGLTVILKVPVLTHMIQRPRRILQWQLWVLLIANLLMSALDLYISLQEELQEDILQFLGIILPDMTTIVAVLLLKSRSPTIVNLTSTPCGRKLVYLAKVISAVWLPFSSVLTILSRIRCRCFPYSNSPKKILSRIQENAAELTYVSYFGISFATLVLSLGSLQHPVDSLFGRWIDAIMHILFLCHLVLPLPDHYFFLSEIDINPFNPFVYGLSFITLLVLLLNGNLQIPAAFVQVLLSSVRLRHHFYSPLPQGTSPNMVPAIEVFYVLALCQGSFYIMACILGFFSFFPRRSLVHDSIFSGQGGAKAIDIYYQHAFATCMETGVLAAQKTLCLSGFAMESLRSNASHEMQLAGVLVLDRLLQESNLSSNQELISRIMSSNKVLSTLVGILADNVRDRDVRLCTARVTANLAGGRLRICDIPGMVKSITSLLHVLSTQPTDQEFSAQTTSSDVSVAASNQPPTDGRRQSAHAEGNDGWLPLVCSFWRGLKEKWSVSGEPPLTPQDSLPVLGMVILERLARDPDNCTEIIKATNLISKIIGFTSYESSNDAEQNAVLCSSLNLVTRLATTEGKIGATLRQELWENPFLLTNIQIILQDSSSSPQIWKPSMDIIANLALDEGAREEIGSNQVIICKLVDAFVIGRGGPTKTHYDQSLRISAGEALANLAMDSPANCLAILRERPGYEVVKDLTDMLGNGEYNCVSANLLQNLCACSTEKLCDPGARCHLFFVLPMVLENIMAAEGKKLEALIGLASQICYVLPSKCFVQGLESSNIGKLVQKLVATLNSNKKPSPEYPRMRRVIIEMALSVMEISSEYPRYKNIFGKEMKEALSKVFPSKVEKFRVYLGNEGAVVENGDPLSILVARAKGKIDPANSTSGTQPGDHA